MHLWKFPYGYAKIEVVCGRPERAINEVIACGYSLHNIERLSINSFRAVVRFSQYDGISDILNELGGGIKLLNRGGASVLFREMLSRKALLITVFAGVLTMFILSGRVLSIDIECADAFELSAINALLEQKGISRGISVADIDKASLAKMIADSDDRIGFAKVSIDGVVLKINAYDGKTVSYDADKMPTSIFADKDCIIISVAAFDGKAEVKAGDAVKKDQLLVSGDITPEQGEEQVLTHSEAEIIGEVAYGLSVRVKSKAPSPTRSGRCERSIETELFGLNIHSAISFADYEMIEQHAFPFDATFLPVFVRDFEMRELVLKERQLSKQEMLDSAVKEINSAVYSVIPEGAVIISKSTELNWENDGSLTAYVTVHTYEKIGYTRYI